MGKGGQEQATVLATASTNTQTNDKKTLPTGSIPAKTRPGVTWKSPYDPFSSTKLPTKGQVKAVIPAHCFERSYVKSFFYLFRDLFMATACVMTAQHCLSTTLPTHDTDSNTTALLLWTAGWSLYAACMGTVCTGLWVLAHECGHGAFTDSQFVNNVVGFTLHQAVLVPYFGWQYTHAKHHRRTNHLNDGESHVPMLPEGVGLDRKSNRVLGGAMIHAALGDDGYALVQIWIHLAIGWPLYLLGICSTTRIDPQGKWLGEFDFADHFRPNSRMFPAHMVAKVAFSSATVVATIVGLVQVGLSYGWLPLFLWYGYPYLVVNVWLVLYTWLQHTDPSVPHYDDEHWTWIKGALGTIDRSYGIFDFFHHNIGSTHVAHHLFHEMPCYHAAEATACLKAYLEPMGLYNYDPTPIGRAMWNIAHSCHFVEDSVGVQYYRGLDQVLGKTKEAHLATKFKVA